MMEATLSEEGVPEEQEVLELLSEAARAGNVPAMKELRACHRERELYTSEHDLVSWSELGKHLGYKALKDRYREALRRAGLRPDFRFHNLRHTFGSTVIRHADSREFMEWMGHAELATTRRYFAFVDREDAAKRVSEAFRFERPVAEDERAALAAKP